MPTTEILAESRVTAEQLDKMKFGPLRAHEFISGCKHTSLPGLSDSTNPWHNCVTVYAERKLAPRSTFMGKTEKYGSDWTEYSVVVQGDQCGETRDEITLPKGTDLKAAKAKAIELAKMYANDGDLYI
jgi:hypothetical protein